LPQPQSAKVEADDNPVLDLSIVEPLDSSIEHSGIHLVESPAATKVRKKSLSWSSGTGPAVQLSLFG
jgi:S-ribosylhomocysteine lyase LuxS involved in autoinducer biosynthesis